MNISTHHSTPKHGLSATKQATRESGGSRKFFKANQLHLWESPQSKPETEHSLHMEPLPPALQWWDEERFWLIHSATGLRVPGSWTPGEAELILDLSKNWDWSVDKERRVACGFQLIALAESVCKHSCQKGGEG